MMGKAFFHALRYFTGTAHADTQTTEAERTALRRHASECRRAVEIGVYQGVNTRLIAESLPKDGRLYAIDPFFTGRLPICWGELIAHHHVRRGRVSDRVHFVKALSWEACSRLEGTFDFIFVDGDHSYEGVKRDWADWSSRLETGGRIAMHDTRVPAHDPSVAQLGSHQFFEQHIQHDERFKIIEQVDSLSVLRRL